MPGTVAGLFGDIRTIETMEDWDADGRPDRVIFTRDDTFVFLSSGNSFRVKGRSQSKQADPTPDGCTWAPDFDFTDICNEHDRRL